MKKKVALFMSVVMLATAPMSTAIAVDESDKTALTAALEEETAATQEAASEEITAEDTDVSVEIDAAENDTSTEADLSEDSSDGLFEDEDASASEEEQELSVESVFESSDESGVSDGNADDITDNNSASSQDTAAIESSEDETENIQNSSATSDGNAAAISEESSSAESSLSNEVSAVDDDDEDEDDEEYDEAYIYFDYSGMTLSYDVLTGTEVTMEVLLEDWNGELSYQWYYYEEDEEELDAKILSEETGSSYAITATEVRHYICEVTAATETDSCTKTITFYVDATDFKLSYMHHQVAHPGESFTLSVTVNAVNPDELTYQWYTLEYDGDTEVLTAIEGETAASMTIPTVTFYGQYKCIVSSESTTKEAFFSIYLDSGLSITSDCNYYYMIEPGESVELSVSATSVYGNTPTYQWYWYQTNWYDYEAIDGATTDSYTANKSGYYYCEAYDGYTSTVSDDFRIYVNSGLTVTADGSDSVKINAGETATLSVTASTENGPLSYQWYRNYRNSEMIEGATDSELEVNQTGYYACLVSDTYSAMEVDFEVVVNNNMSVSYNSEVYFVPGDTVEMMVNASADVGEISYTWYYYDDDYSTVYMAETSNILHLEGITEEKEYRCDVTDEYGNSETAYFELVQANELTLSYTESYSVGVNDTLPDLFVKAVSPYDTITYQWYIYDGENIIVEDDAWYNDFEGSWEEISGATSATLPLMPEYADEYYKCVVSDGINTETAIIAVDMISNLSLSYDRTTLTLEPGESGTLTVTATSDKTDATYTFILKHYERIEYENDEESLYGYRYVQIGSVESNESGTAEFAVSEPGRYWCSVSDSYETRSAYFTVQVNSGFSVTASTEQLVESGGSITLSVEASTEAGTLSYSWFYYDDGCKTVIGDNTSDLFLANPTESRYYYCLVSDGYNSEYLTFRVEIVDEIGETATSFSEAKTLTVGTSQLATIASSGAYMYFKVVPATTGTYTFYTVGDRDTYGSLYDASQTLLTANDDIDEAGGNYNFKITYTLTAGTTYYLSVMPWSGIGVFPVYMVSGDSICSHANVTHTDAIGATCTTAGYVEYWTCEDCGAKFTDSTLMTMVTDVSAAVTEHNWDAGTTTKAATCTASGTKLYTCTNCGATKTETIAATGHNAGSVTYTPAKAATCAATGNIAYWHCTDCGKYFSNSALTTEVSVSSLTTAKLSTHTYGAWTTTKEATALETGTQTRTCSVCGKIETQTIAKLTPTIKVNASSIKLKVKQSTTALKVTGLASGDAVAKWKSSNTKIVTVNAKGKITAKNKTGTAYITITLKSGKTKKIKVTVQKSAVKTTKITVAKKSVSLKKGKTYTIKPTISPITSVQKVTYSSSNKKVATVNSKGKITAKKKGTATITVKSGSKKVKVKVTVK